MVLNPRPSKISFRRILNKFINKSEPFNTILDCASAGDKFLNLFPGKKYYGVDINKKLIEKAKEKNIKNNNAHFIHDDLLKFENLEKLIKFDLVITTHTFMYIEKSNKDKALQNLIDKVNNNGSFILQCSKEDIDFVKKHYYKFKKIIKKPYRGLLSKIFDKMLSLFFNTDELGKLGETGRINLYKRLKKIILAFSFIISLIDQFIFPNLYLIHFKGKI